MPFQSEKQRRYLHANHPEIAKRWEREYANGGISNHFRKKYIYGGISHPDGRRGFPGGAGTPGGYQADWGGPTFDNIGGEGGPPSILNPPPKGPTATEIAAAKAVAEAKAAAEKKAIADAQHKEWITRKDKKKKKVNWAKKNWEDVKALSTVPLNMVKGAFGNPFNPDELTTATLTDAMKEDLIAKAKAKGTSTGNIDFTAYNTPTKTFSGLNKFMDPIDIANALTMGGTSFKTDELGNIEFTGGKYDFNKSSNPVLGFIDQGGLMGASKKLGEKIYDVTHKAAKGGVARKNYFHGGILGLNESEEIISDDGNDIELTDYNAAFDDPNDLSTGVKSLFQAKDGGRIGFFTGMREQEQKAQQQGPQGPPGGGDPGMTYTAPTTAKHHPGADTGEEEEAYVVVNGNKVPVDSAEYHRIEADKFRAAQVYKVLKRKDLTKEEKNKQLKWQWDEGQKVWKSISNVKEAFALNPILGILAGWYEGNKLKKEQEAEISKLEKQLGLLEDWEMKSRHHTVDTPTQILEQRILNLTQPRDRDDIERNEFFVPTIKLLEEEMDDTQEDYGYVMSDLDRIRAGQAKRAMIQPDWQNPENILVANRGGLANLFRVKNQQ